jgi:translation initiation factor 3 subunit E
MMPAPSPAVLPCGRYLTAIQLTSQHLLRYLAVAVVVNKRRRNVLNDLKRVVSQETYEYR